MSGASIWEQFTLDPRPSGNAHLRAGDHDRDVVNDLLGTAYSEGRLSAEAERKYRQRRQQALTGWLTPTFICWVVWLLTMPGDFPWPVFVTVGTGVRFLQLVGTRNDTIAGIEHGLQRRERRRLERRDRRRQLGGPPPPPDAT